MSSQLNQLDNIQVDAANLYREESITDLKVASLRKLVPIKLDGSDDPGRAVSFLAQTHVMSQAGPLPVNAQLEANTLEDAIKEFPGAVKKAVEEMINEVKEYQRQQAGKIVVPEAGGVNPGNIQMP